MLTVSMSTGFHQLTRSSYHSGAERWLGLRTNGLCHEAWHSISTVFGRRGMPPTGIALAQLSLAPVNYSLATLFPPVPVNQLAEEGCTCRAEQSPH